MALSVKVGNFVIPSGTNVSGVVGLGFKPIAIFMAGSEVMTGSSMEHLQATIGVAISGSSSTDWCMGGFITGTDTGPQSNFGYNGVDAYRNVQYFATKGAMTIQSYDADGFTINASSFPNSHSINYLAIGGADIINAKNYVYSRPTASGLVNYTDVGFQPDMMVFENGAQTPFLVQYGMGFATPVSQTYQMSQIDNGVGMGTPPFYLSFQNKVLDIIRDTTYYMGASVSGVLSNGFALSWSFSSSWAGSSRVACLQGGNYAAGEFYLTGTDQVSVTGLSFQPKAVFLRTDGYNSRYNMSNTANSWGLRNYACRSSFGFCSDTTTRNINWTSEFWIKYPNVISKMWNSSANVVELHQITPAGSSSLLCAASMSSFNSDGFTLNVSKKPFINMGYLVSYAAFG